MPSARAALGARIDAQLDDLVSAHQQAGNEMCEELAEFYGQQVYYSNDKLLLPVILEPVDGTARDEDLDALERIGGQVDAVSDSFIRVLMPPAKVLQLKGNKRYRVARMATLALADAGPNLSESVALTGADIVHAAGVDGTGVKVAVMDLGFIGLAARIAEGELPNIVIVNLPGTNDDAIETGSSHGVGVAEQLADMAPGAEIHCIKVLDTVDLQNATAYIATNNISIVNHSVGWVLASYYDDTGWINAIVNNSRDNDGVFWSLSAGNQALRHWRGGWVDDDADDFLDFATNDDRLDITSQYSTVQLFLNWDQYSNSLTDLDLYVYDKDDLVVASSTGPQSGAETPSEAVTFTLDTNLTPYTIEVHAFSGPTNDLDITIFSFNNNLEHAVAASAFLDPANAHGSYTVAAVNQAVWTDSNPPVASYSSNGPTNDGRQKPNITAPDGTVTRTYGASFGTSFSAPTVAGAAALLLDEDPTRTAGDLEARLTALAEDIGAPGIDMVFGAGKLHVALDQGSSITISNVAIDAPVNPLQTPRHGKLELDVTLADVVATKFFNADPADGGIDLNATFTGPDASDWDVNGFFDGSGWRLRFSPELTGTWTFTVTVTDASGTDTWVGGSFTCVDLGNPGWPRLAGRYLELSTGEPLFAVGHNNGWQYDLEVPSFTDMAANGENLLGYWMGVPWAERALTSSAEPYWDDRTAIENLEQGLGNYNQEACQYLDGLVERAETDNIYLLPAIWSHGQLRDATHPWSGSANHWWYNNPYNTITTPTDFFRTDAGGGNDTQQWKLQKHFLRYVMARWGHSRAIAGWVLIVEIDGTVGFVQNPTQTNAWIASAQAYFAGLDPYRNNALSEYPMTVSKVNDTSYDAGLDVRSSDSFSQQFDDVAVGNAIATETRAMRTSGKPVFHGEFGGDTTGGASEPAHMHNGVWAGVAAGAAMTPLKWADGGNWPLFDNSPTGQALVAQLSILSDFVNGLSYITDAALVESNASVTGAGGLTWGMNLSDKGFAWIQTTSGVPGGRTFTVTGLTPGVYVVNWYDVSASGTAPLQTDGVTVAGDGILNAAVPSIGTSDIALAFSPDTGPPVITCPADATIECAQPTDPGAAGSATATDDCLVTVSYDDVTLPSCQILSYVDSGQALGGSVTFDIVLGDLDGDGDLDAVFAEIAGTVRHVWLNNGGLFTYSGQTLSLLFTCVTLADIDGDNDLDAIVGTSSTQSNLVYVNDGTGTFTIGSSLGNSPAQDVESGDFDGDNDIDVLIATSGSGGDEIWFNDGAGNFLNSGQSIGSTTTYGASVGDIDGDNDLDIWTAHSGPNRVFINDGSGIFTDSGQSLGSLISREVVLGDLDGDGDLDAFTANISTDGVWINDGSGNFTAGTPLPAAVALDLALADVDGDGDLDALIAVINAPDKIWINDGTANFTDSGLSIATSRTLAVAMGDVDNDGDIDLMIGRTGLTANQVHLNDGCDSCVVTINRTWTAVDCLANSSECLQLITVEDTTAPVVTCPANITISCGPSASPSGTSTATATDNCHGASAVSLSESVASGSCPVESVISRTWSSTDGCGNVGNCVQTITVTDNIAPVISCPANVTVECDASTAAAGTGTGTATDNCTGTPVMTSSDSIASGSCADASIITRTWTATDDCGNSSNCDQIITVADSTAPVITCPANVTVECDASTAASSTGTATATDNCDAAPVVSTGTAAPSVARQWNEALLQAIRQDFARPTVHARNLFHTAVAMYDAWAVYDAAAGTFLLGKTVDGYTSAFAGIPVPGDKQAAQEATLSHAVYRLLSQRFAGSPGAAESLPAFDALFAALGYDAQFISTDYAGGSAEALGNYIAQTLIDFGNQDGANEQGGYGNLYYQPVNAPLVTKFSGNPHLTDPNHWQPLTLDTFIDQAGNEIPFNTPDFLSPEWGNVTAFALQADDLTVNTRDGHDYWTYHDPGPPPYIDATNGGGLTDEYRWNFELVAIWSSHLDPADTLMWDISPASIGNVQSYPTTIQGLPTFYDLENGGDHGIGHDVNPHTGQPYAPQLVKRSDYARVLAEFWADGPDSETPPGHWFTLLNYVSDHPQFEKRFRGQGDVLDDLEWDVKACFLMGGAMHDAAVAAWGAKGWYDYIRPISAIRWLADLGQHSIPNVPSYHPAGISLINDYIELVAAGDPLAGANGQHVGKIKVKSWRGPDYIVNPATDVAGVDWILAENWWSYQRPTFVTPPFAGYVSGHSTFSRAAAEVMTLLTGDPFFPGGMGEFTAEQNSFLVFEDGPSADVVLQWATYRDASDQCSLSRIWGGIHPPADDIPGRLMGIEIGIDAFTYGEAYFTAELLHPAPGSCPYPSTITRTWIATDACGNSSNCTQTITMVDSTAPVITCPANVTVECDASTAAAGTGTAAATDNCDPAPVVSASDSVASGSCANESTITRTWTATDACGNVGNDCLQTITIVDTTAPVVTCPANITISCGASTSPSGTGIATATDTCDPAPTISHSDSVVGSCPQTITRTWSADDDCGNSSVSCEQTITLILGCAPDITAPVITCPANVTVECNTATTPETTGTATTTDFCDSSPVITFVDAVTPGTCPQSQVITRTWTATDSDANDADCQQTITSIDNAAPVVTRPNHITIGCNHTTDPGTTGTAAATDNCDGAPAISFSDSTAAGSCPDQAVIMRTWTATDACGNVANDIQSITVVDTAAPVITCPVDLTIACSASSATTGTGIATATDNCSTAPVVNYTDSVAAGSCAHESVITRTWTATDACGNFDNCDQIIYIVDTAVPEITAPHDILVECDESTAPANTGTAAATDNCAGAPGVTFSDNIASGACEFDHVITRTWTATDTCGNFANVAQTVTIVDSTPPALACPADVTIECNSSTATAGTGVASATDNCDAIPSLAYSDSIAAGTCADESVISRNWHSVDSCGNASACVQTITIVDTTAPVVTAPADITIACIAILDHADATDNCDAAPVISSSDSVAAGTCPGHSPITRTWTATDDCGNAGVDVQIITVIDNAAPIITCPANITVECDASTAAANTGTATATDDCDSAPGVTSLDSVAAGTCAGASVITRTWTATDACGNAGNCAQTITIVDTTVPVITCPANVTVECDASTAAANTGTATATDDCDSAPGLTSSDSVAAGTCAGASVITRTWTATDACGNAGNCAQTITIVDTTVPVITCPANVTVECDASTAAANTGTASATDDCDSAPGVTSSDNVAAGTCAGASVITRTWTATDACGNSSHCNQTVTVADSAAPTISAPADVTVQCGASTAPASTGTASGSDNCGAPAVTFSDSVAAGSCVGLPVITRTWTVTDNCGNTANAVQTVTVIDTVNPVITCPVDVTIACTATSAPASTGIATATDNCGTTVSYSDVVNQSCPTLSFVDSGQALGLSSTRDVALGDLDGDGDLDAVFAETGGTVRHIWLNSGGFFTYSGQTLSLLFTCVTLADIDGDNDLDAIVGTSNSQSNLVYINDGTGTFTTGSSLGNSRARDIESGDFDGDNDIDVLIATSGSGGDEIWFNDGAGNFLNSGQSIGSTTTYGASVGDIDGDNDLDIWTVHTGPNRVFINDGAGIFTDSGQLLGSLSSREVVLGDLDGDNDIDAFVANTSTDGVWINDGSGNFSAGTAPPLSVAMDADLADVDNDGDLDVLIAVSNAPDKIWINDGAANFTDSGLSIATKRTFAVAMGDVDNDGDIDLMIGRTGRTANQVHLNDSCSPCGGSITRTWIVSDCAGNSSDCVQTISIEP